MRIENGRVILGVKDTRIGNFVLTDQEHHWQAQDIGRRFVVRVHKDTLMGRIISLGVKGELGERYLSNWITTMFDAVLTVHDEQSMKDIITACKGATLRNPELYGGKKEPTSDEEDAKILAEQKAVAEIVEKVESLPTEEPGDD